MLSSGQTGNWKEVGNLSFKTWYETVWQLALDDKLTQECREARGVALMDIFVQTWYLLICYTTQGVGNTPPRPQLSGGAFLRLHCQNRV